VHELGHFVVARRNGIRADEFGFGFPPRIAGIQFLSGKEIKKIKEVESVKVEMIDVQSENKEIVRESVTKRINNVERNLPVKKWRIIWGNRDGDNSNEMKDLREAHEKRFSGSTIYSLNWIPVGGFVKIKGEDGENRNDPDSFSGKSAWIRTKVLAAGVTMNFILAWILITLGLVIGAPEAIDPGSNKNIANSKIQISQILPDSPASAMGIKVGDEVLRTQIDSLGKKQELKNSKDVQDFINSQKGREISLNIKRGGETFVLKGIPRIDTPQNQGALGIALVETAIVRYPWYQAIWKGLISVIDLSIAILLAFFEIIRNLVVGKGISADVSGPVGIAVLTGEVTKLGLIYVLQFAALLSINLGIINILPIPALDGGRILFVIIEKIKGSPVSRKVEQMIHAVGFALLITLMILVTFKDVVKFVK